MKDNRTFIAIPLPQEIQTGLGKIEQQLADQNIRSIRWVAPNNIHLTLHFLGEISTVQVNTLTASLRPVIAAQDKLSIEVGGIGAFPNLRQPRVVWVGLQAPAQLKVLNTLVGRVVQQTGIPVENRAFSPHLTLGRVKRDTSPTDLKYLTEILATTETGPIGTIRVNAVTLFKSDLHPQGPIYTPLAQFPLHG